MAESTFAIKGQAYTFYIMLLSQADKDIFQVNPTLAAGDVKVSIDGGALNNLATLPVVTPAGSKLVKVDLSAAEMNGDQICVVFSDQLGNEWCDWVETITPLASSLAAQMWAYATRTLTQTAAQVAAILAGSDITVQRGDTLSVALTGLGNIAARTKLYFTVKVNPSRDPDTAAILKIEETAGLTVVNGVAYTTVANGDITVDDEADGDVTITVDEAVTALLMVASGLYYDIQMVSAAGVVTLTAGRMTVAADVTRAVS